jgi:ABC-type nitrate/sulfonate/bicarbonate transport system substrate-binding protein
MQFLARWLPDRLIWLALLALAACAPQPAAPVEVTRLVEVTAPPRLIRVAYASEADFGDVPTLLALRRLADQGYAVLPINYAQPEIAVEALARGDADLGAGSMRTYWAAVSQGARLATVMEQLANNWEIYAAPDIQGCADLDGRRFAISGSGSVSSSMSSAYVEANCPGTERQIVIIQGSSNRAAALLSGEVDATPVELADAIEIERQAPGKFHALTIFRDDLPGLKTTGIQVSRDFAEQNPQAVRDFIRAVLAVHREINQNHDLLARAAAERLGIDSEVLPQITDAYFAINAWDANGGLTTDDVQYTLDFFTGTGDLAPGLTVSQVSDLSYLEDVLAEIGRQE